MVIDFKPVSEGKLTLLEYSAQFAVDDLRRATNESVDSLLELIKDLNDADIVFDPHDPQANDPHAVAGEEHIGWGIGHLIAHVTASAEEWATYSSILARSVPYSAEPRLRYETHWRAIDTKAKAVQRQEESRRIRLAYLDTWPDAPNLQITREISPRFIARHGELNATACFLFGLRHEVGHYGQFQEVKRQILANRQTAAAG
jgi:DinB superfamily